MTHYRENLRVSGPSPFSGPDRSTFSTWLLLAINTCVFIAATVAGGTENSETLLNFGAMFDPLIANGEYWRLFTAMFLHIGFTHLFVNSFALYAFGPLVERLFGHSRFVIIYLLGGLTGSVVSYLFNSISIGAGASGSVFAIIGGLSAFFLTKQDIFGKVDHRSLMGLAILVSINLIFGIIMPGIDNWAHVGGLAGGFILGLILTPKYKRIAPIEIGQVELTNVNSLTRTFWVLPLWLAILTAGILLGGVTMPETPFTHIFLAERHYQNKEYSKALEKLETAFSYYHPEDIEHPLGTKGNAHLLRGKIYIALEVMGQARAELADAILYGDRPTRLMARELLVAISLIHDGS